MNVLLRFLLLMGLLVAYNQHAGAVEEHPLPAFIDAATEAPHSQIGEGRVVDIPLGSYREAGSDRFDRIAYLFKAMRAGDLTRLTLAYPDDKPRIAEILAVSPSRPLLPTIAPYDVIAWQGNLELQVLRIDAN